MDHRLFRVLILVLLLGGCNIRNSFNDRVYLYEPIFRREAQVWLPEKTQITVSCHSAYERVVCDENSFAYKYENGITCKCEAK